MSILFITGAGISKASGIPTYRGEGGLYNGVDVASLLHVDGVTKNPAIFREMFAPLMGKKYQPNEAHRLLSEISKKGDHMIATQNVDSLHGNAIGNVLELHGNMISHRCLRCGTKGIDPSTHPPACKSSIIPNVVLFGENPFRIDDMFAFAKHAAYVVTIGTSSTFSYITHAIHVCKQRGGKHIDINPEQTDVNMYSRNCDHIPENAIDGIKTMIQKYNM